MTTLTPTGAVTVTSTGRSDPLRAGRKTSELLVTVLAILLGVASLVAGITGVGHPPAVARDAMPGVGVATAGGAAAFYAIGRSGLKAFAVMALHWAAGNSATITTDAQAALDYVKALAAETTGRAPVGTAAQYLAKIDPPASSMYVAPLNIAGLEQELRAVIGRHQAAGARPTEVADALVRVAAPAAQAVADIVRPPGGTMTARQGPPVDPPPPVPGQGAGPGAIDGGAGGPAAL